MRIRALAVALSTLSFAAASASAQTSAAPAAPTGAPPAEAKTLVEGPGKAPEAPKTERKLDGTTVSVSAGGLLTTGNSKLLAVSGSGSYETRFDDNGIGASLVGNFGQGAPAGEAVRLTAENLQGRLRYDRYLVDALALFLINTGRHDRFQGLDFRYNLDPGVKYLFFTAATSSLWAEAGYDLQYDIRRNADRTVVDDDGNPVLDPAGNVQILDKTATDHSTRLFVGLKHGFNKEVTISSGLEYLQSVVDSTRYRVNYDLVFAANVGSGLAVGLGFGARFDHAPLPGKEKLDTSTTVSLIYAFSDVPEPPKPKTCPCPEPAAATPTGPAAPPGPPPPPPPVLSPSDPYAPAPPAGTPEPGPAAPPLQTIPPPPEPPPPPAPPPPPPPPPPAPAPAPAPAPVPAPTP
jgi:hypothetical protein